MRFAFALALMLAAGTAVAADTYRFDRGVIAVGDSTGTVVQKAGRQPDRIVQLENRLGAASGERWEYYERGKTVLIIIRGGQVQSIEDVR
jgi:hypothetical protein